MKFFAGGGEETCHGGPWMIRNIGRLPLIEPRLWRFLCRPASQDDVAADGGVGATLPGWPGSLSGCDIFAQVLESRMTEEVAALIYSMIFSSCKNHFYFRIFELQWAFLCLQVFFSCIFYVFLDKGLHMAFRSRLISAGFCHSSTPLVDQVIKMYYPLSAESSNWRLCKYAAVDDYDVL